MDHLLTDWIIERADRYQILDIGPGTKLARLDPERAKRFWAGMRREDPGMAELVAEIGPKMREMFDAQLVVSDDEAKTFMGKQ